MRDEEKEARPCCTWERRHTGTNTSYTYTRKGMAAAILLSSIQSYTIAMTLRVGYEQRRRRDSFYVVFAFEIGFVGGCSVRVFERSFEGGSATYGGSAHMSSADWRRFG